MNRMHCFAVALVLASALICASAAAQAPLDSSFTYQGVLKSDGTSYNGTADFTFALFDAQSSGTQVGSTFAANGIVVIAGTFTVSLDFGALAFNGDERWLEIAVHTPGNGGVGSFTTLTPRQRLAAAPYAHFALNVANPSPFVFNGANAGFTGGNVGIGVASPLADLHVAGDAIFTGGLAVGTTPQTMSISASAIAAPDLLDIDANANLTVDANDVLRLEGSQVNIVGAASVSVQGAIVSIGGLATLGIGGGIGGGNGGFMLGVNGTAGKPGGGSWAVLSDA